MTNLLADTGAPSSAPLPAVTPARGTRRMRVALLTGCVARWMFPGVNAATVRLLSAAGCEVVVPPGQGCCGALHSHSGDADGARHLLRRNIEAFEAAGEMAGPVDAVVVNAAGCGSAMKECDRLLADEPAWAERARALAARTRDALELLAESSDLPLTRPVEARVAYHDACHLAHGQGVRSGPRELLARIPGLSLVPLADADRCCGSAGIYNLLHPDAAASILEPKLARVADSGATVLAAANPGCLMQIAAGARAAGLDVRTAHPIELLDQALETDRSNP
jgi:glycolate oxidase iron-sulfur subunit